ncbi:MAG: OmpA family protein [Pseudomonadota bacterium]
MRPIALLYAALVFGLTAAAGWGISAALTERVEARTELRVDRALIAADAAHWADVETDGLVVRLLGEAPDAETRDLTLALLGSLLDPARIEDATTLAPPVPDTPPAPLAFEILVADGRLSLIGTLPDDPEAGERLAAGLGALPDEIEIVDLSETVRRDAPPGWSESLRVALTAARLIPDMRARILPGRVEIGATVASRDTRLQLEQRLRPLAPAEAELELALTAPIPLVSPYVFEARLTGDGLEIAACTAPDPAAAERIGAAIAALPPAGGAAAGPCRIGLGVPSPLWPDAIEAGLAALPPLGPGARFRIMDTRIALEVPGNVPEAEMTAVVAELAEILPIGFVFEAMRGEAVAVAAITEPEPAAGIGPVFEAVLAADGTVTLTGPVGDPTAATAVTTLAAALFGGDAVTATLAPAPELPAGWPGRVLISLEALASLEEGSVRVEPDALMLTGVGAEADVARRVRAFLRPRIDEATRLELDIAYRPPPPVEPVAMAGPLCIAEITARLEESQIQFAPSSAVMTPESLTVVDAIAEVMKGCGETVFEIAGYTDSSGREEVNLGLSQARAESVVDALLARGVFIDRMVAQGYGEADPIASNETEEGRARNRRIEVREAAAATEESAEDDTEEDAADGTE